MYFILFTKLTLTVVLLKKNKIQNKFLTKRRQEANKIKYIF